MKNFRNYTLIALTAISLAACSSDDDGDTPEIINEEEIITTVTFTLQSGTETVVFTSRDTDGDGPNEPTVSVVGSLDVSTEYTGNIVFLNETVSPAENITEEVVEEADEHQVFYTPSSGVDATIAYDNFDSNNNPLGTLVTLTTGVSTGTGSLTITLRHEPTKPNDGTLSNAGGETDVQVTFPVIIE